ncbi:MAG: hypothetical protein MJH10_18675 [Epibacterium sp.]|nr:hypothetical protein [Epibacterium sp.]NQX75509.1 hypothetical protein [Epibacterium sp.]
MSEAKVASISVELWANTQKYISSIKAAQETTAAQVKKMGGSAKRQTTTMDAEARKQAAILRQQERDRKAEALAAVKANKIKMDSDKRASEALAKRGRESSRIMGQLGFQIQDSAVQAQMGINPFTIVAQQGSQALGAFGPAGAIAGAGLAIVSAGLGVLAPSMFKTVDVMKNMEEAANKLGDVFKYAAGETTYLNDEFQQLLKTDKAAAEFKLNQELIDVKNSAIATAAAAAKLSDELGDINWGMDVNVRQAAKGAGKEIQGLASSAGRIQAEQAKKLSDNLIKIYDITAKQAEKIIKATAAFQNQQNESTAKSLQQAYGEASHTAINGSKKQVAAFSKIFDIVNKITEPTLRRVEIEKMLAKLAKDPSTVTKTKKELELTKSLTESLKQQLIAKRQAAALAAAPDKAAKLAIEMDNEKVKLAAKYGSLSGTDDYLAAIAAIEEKYRQKKLTIEDAINAKRLAAENKLADKKTNSMLKAMEVEKTEKTKAQAFTDNLALTDEQKAIAKFAKDKAYLDTALLTQRISKTDHNLALEEMELQHKTKLLGMDAELRSKENELMVTSLDSIAGMQTTLEEDASSTQKALFLMSQAAAAASVTMSMFDAAGKANAAAGGGIAGTVAETNEYVKGGIKLASIAGTTIGQFHGGVDELPTAMNNKSFMLKAGERVVQPEANKKLTKFLNNPEASGGGGGVTINAPVTMGPSLVDPKVMAQALSKQQTILAAIVQKEQRKRPSRTSTRNK